MSEPFVPEPVETVILPPSLKVLKWLVIVLMITMIGGVITITGLLVTRMPDAGEVLTKIPPDIALPDGVKAEAVTLGKGWVGVVSQDGRMFIFNPDGSLRQEIRISP